mgnify:CR=1 FL=1
MNIKITIKNALTGVKELDFTAIVVEGADVDYMHKGYSEAYPDSFVNFKMDDGGFIAGQPYNMAADERAHEQGLLSWNDYLKRWYPNLATN